MPNAPKLPTVRTYFDTPSNYLSGNTTIPARVELLRGMIAGRKFGRCIDLGCGDGSIGLGLIDSVQELVLVDISPNMIAAARARTPDRCRSRVSYRLGDASDFTENGFDLVLCIGLLAHVESVEVLLATVARLASPGGLIAIQFSDSSSMWTRCTRWMRQRPTGYALNIMSTASIQQRVASAGLRLESLVTYSGAGFGLGRLGGNWATRFKILTGRLGLHRVFSEKLMLLRKTT